MYHTRFGFTVDSVFLCYGGSGVTNNSGGFMQELIKGVSHENFRKRFDRRLRQVDHELEYSLEMTNQLVEMFKDGIIKIALGFVPGKTLHDILMTEVSDSRGEFRVLNSFMYCELHTNYHASALEILSHSPESEYFSYIAKNSENYDYYLSATMVSKSIMVDTDDDLVVVELYDPDNDDREVVWPVLIPYQYYCDGYTTEDAKTRYSDWLRVNVFLPILEYLTQIKKLKDDTVNHKRAEEIQRIREKISSLGITPEELSNGQ